MHVISGPWWSWLLRGIAAIAFGVLAMVWPGITFLAFVAMFAAYALVDGALHLAAAFRAPQGQPRWLLALQGILGIAVAALTFVWPGITALALLFLIGAWAILGGAMRIALAIQLRKVIVGEWLLGRDVHHLRCAGLPGAGCGSGRGRIHCGLLRHHARGGDGRPGSPFEALRAFPGIFTRSAENISSTASSLTKIRRGRRSRAGSIDR